MSQPLAIGSLLSGILKRRRSTRGGYREIANDGMLGAIRAGRSSLITLLVKVSRSPSSPKDFTIPEGRLMMKENTGGRGQVADFDATSLALRTASPGFGMAFARYHGSLAANGCLPWCSIRKHDDLTTTDHKAH